MEIIYADSVSIVVGFAHLRFTSGMLREVRLGEVAFALSAGMNGSAMKGLRLCTFVHIIKIDEFPMGPQQSKVEL